MAAGAYLLVLGGSLIAVSSLTSSFGFISIAQSQLDAVNLGLKLAFIGLVLAPIGAAILAYGIGASPPARTEYVISPEPSTSKETPTQTSHSPAPP